MEVNNFYSNRQFSPTKTFPFNFINPILQLLHHSPLPGPAVIRRHTPTARQPLLRRVANGAIGAAYTCMAMAVVMGLAVLVGVAAVNTWVEEPVAVREKVQFDYREMNPQALFVFEGRRIPVGHRVYVSLMLLLPESDYNRDTGVFQITTEVISTEGKTITQSSRPTMLHFRSHPIRIARTFSMGLPLLLGLALEAQTIKVQLLKYKESKLLRTSAIELTLSPRAGTTYLPQLYEAEIIIHSHPPWSKDFVRKWKLTFYVWTSLYVFLILLVVIICFCRPLILPDGRSGLNGRGVGRESRAVVEVRRKRVVGEGREFSETLRTWQQYRRRRRAELLSSRQELVAATTGSASSYTITKGLESYGGGTKEDVGDSESVCMGG